MFKSVVITASMSLLFIACVQRAHNTSQIQAIPSEDASQDARVEKMMTHFAAEFGKVGEAIKNRQTVATPYADAMIAFVSGDFGQTDKDILLDRANLVISASLKGFEGSPDFLDLVRARMKTLQDHIKVAITDNEGSLHDLGKDDEKAFRDSLTSVVWTGSVAPNEGLSDRRPILATTLQALFAKADAAELSKLDAVFGGSAE